jgi:hypothetical protein
MLPLALLAVHAKFYLEASYFASSPRNKRAFCDYGQDILQLAYVGRQISNQCQFYLVVELAQKLFLILSGNLKH